MMKNCLLNLQKIFIVLEGREVWCFSTIKKEKNNTTKLSSLSLRHVYFKFKQQSSSNSENFPKKSNKLS